MVSEKRNVPKNLNRQSFSIRKVVWKVFSELLKMHYEQSHEVKALWPTQNRTFSGSLNINTLLASGKLFQLGNKI